MISPFSWVFPNLSSPRPTSPPCTRCAKPPGTSCRPCLPRLTHPAGPGSRRYDWRRWTRALEPLGWFFFWFFISSGNIWQIIYIYIYYSIYTVYIYSFFPRNQHRITPNQATCQVRCRGWPHVPGKTWPSRCCIGPRRHRCPNPGVPGCDWKMQPKTLREEGAPLHVGNSLRIGKHIAYAYVYVYIYMYKLYIYINSVYINSIYIYCIYITYIYILYIYYIYIYI